MLLKSFLANFLLLPCLLLADMSFSQQKDDTDHIQHLIITNDNNEILMVENTDGWLTPALDADAHPSLSEGLDSVANVYGLKLARPSLGGLYTFKFTTHDKINYKTHMKLTLVSGELKVPKDKLDARWVSMAEAKRLMNLPSYKAIPFLRATTVLIFDELEAY